MNTARNKIKTPGYFLKRLRDNGYIVIKIFREYSKTDPRAWTIMLNPGGSSVYITCYRNREQVDEVEFELNDGGIRIPKNFFIKTDSLEVIIEYLQSRGISNTETWPLKDKFIAKRLNIVDEPQPR